MKKLLAATLLALLPPAQPTVIPPALRHYAERAGVRVGTAVNAAYLPETAYTDCLSREFNMLEPEDAMKWAALRPSVKDFDFAAADRLVAFAQIHNMSVRGHNLVWGTHNPDWLQDGHYSARQLNALLKDHIQRVMKHYRGKVFAWDVVNEALDAKGNLRDSIWYNQPGIGFAGHGTAYISQAFRWAHAADPQALLFYNEAEAEFMSRKSDAVYAMVRDFKRQGVPIDGVGLQMHILDLQIDSGALAENLARLTKLGIQVQITEMDVALPVDAAGNPLHEDDLAKQAEIYREVATVCLQNRRCTALQTWGFTDKYSWIGWYTHKTKGDALLFDKAYRAKPAYSALRDALSSSPRR